MSIILDDFTGLHNHSMGSLLDGLPTPEEIVERAKRLGHSSVAITDHGSMSTAVMFYQAAQKAGIKPILGVEGYLTAGGLDVKEPTDKIYHIGLLAKNEAGYRNLCKLSNIGWNKGFYKRPRLNLDALTEHSEGIIVLSGCMQGVISQALINLDTDVAISWAKSFTEIFKEDFYVEVQPWNEPGLNDALMKVADTLGIELVATTDSHFCSLEDAVPEEVALMINQTGEMKKREREGAGSKFQESRTILSVMDKINYLYPERKLRFDKIKNYMMGRDELKKRFLEVGIDRDDIYDNTLKVAEKVTTWDLTRPMSYLPEFDKHYDSHEYLTELAFDKLEEVGLLASDEYADRLEEELHVIGTLNFSNYMLIVWDVCNWARSNNIIVGPGRGSVGGSLLAFVLGITRIDPIKHNLLFWRFLALDESGKSGRIDPPDIDTDVEDRRREDVKRYIAERWGHVMNITSVSTFTAKGMVRDISRVFAIPLDQVNEVCKNFDSMEDFLELDSVKYYRDRYPEIVDVAKKLEGRWRFSSLHPAGLVVADRPLEEILPLESRADKTKTRVPCTAYDMEGVADLSLIKFDFLGIRMLSVIHDCQDKIVERRGKKIDLDSLEYTDESVLKEFSSGHTVGIFQTETESYKRLIKQMGIETFEHLEASNALVRPGPLTTVAPSFIKRKKGTEAIKYDNPKMQEITRETYGLIIYQEQLMQALVEFGGFTKSEADKIRKIIGKKRDEEEFKPFEEQWMQNATETLGITRAKKYWKDFLKFAGYAFNKSHACAYSILSYQTMWLKCYYPLEYMFGLMTNEKDRKQITTFILESRRLGIDILPPDINESETAFSIVGDKAIRFGLFNITGIGAQSVKEIMKKRPFTSLEDFDARIEKKACNSRVRTALIRCGAFSSLGITDKHQNDYSYALLGYPQDLDEDVDLGIAIDNIEDFTQEDMSCVKAIVKSIERKPQYLRVELQDMSDSMSFFTTSDTKITEGRVVVALICGSDLAGFSYLESLKERLEIGGKFSRFESFMFGETFGNETVLYEHGIKNRFGNPERWKEFPPKVLVLPIYKREFRIKGGNMKGQLMASLIVTDGTESKRMILFPDEYGKVYTKLQVFDPIVIKPARTRDGTMTVERDGIRFAKELMEAKNIG